MARGRQWFLEFVKRRSAKPREHCPRILQPPSHRARIPGTQKNAVQIHRAGTAGVRLARTFLQRVVAELRYGPSIASLKFLALAARPFASHWNASPIGPCDPRILRPRRSDP